MFKNKIVAKLSAYFAIALVVFSIIIGGVFAILFSKNTTQLYRKQLLNRATAISNTLSKYLYNNDTIEKRNNTNDKFTMQGYGAYLRFVGDIAMTDVWIIDKDFNLIMSGSGQGIEGYSYQYSDIPENADLVIKKVFSNNTVFSEDFSPLLSQLTITVGTPIKNSDGDILGVVLLHSPEQATNEILFQGLTILSISIFVALALASILSVFLSKNFTDPIIIKQAKEAIKTEKMTKNFVTNISHELRTPVTVMRGSLEALVDGVVTDSNQVKRYHKQMLSEAIFLQRLVGDLLELSKLQNPDFNITKNEIFFNDCLDDVIRSAKHIAKSKNITFDIVKDGTVCKLYGDYGRIRQMIFIVLDNAIKFSSENTTIDIKFKNNTLIIRNFGMEISNNDIPHIFDRFYKSRSERNKTGTGLGLAITKQIADRHNISITVSSDKENGTAFKFHLNNIIK